MGKLKSQLRTCGFWVLEIIPKFSNQRPDVVSQKIVVSSVFSMQQVFRSEEFETRRQDHDWKVFHLPSISTFIHTTLRGHPRTGGLAVGFCGFSSPMHHSRKVRIYQAEKKRYRDVHGNRTSSHIKDNWVLFGKWTSIWFCCLKTLEVNINVQGHCETSY